MNWTAHTFTGAGAAIVSLKVEPTYGRSEVEVFGWKDVEDPFH